MTHEYKRLQDTLNSRGFELETIDDDKPEENKKEEGSKE